MCICTGVLIWRYGAACSSFKIFAAPAAQNAAPGGVKDMGVAEWRKAVDRLYILIFMYTLSALSTCGAAESHSESCGDREGSEIVIPAHRNYRIALEAHNFRGYPPSAKILLP